MSVLELLVAHYGSQNKLAGALNVSSVAVGQWIKSGAIPPLRAIQIEKLTEGKFKAKDLIGV
jgi:DNA-binding transcriptional regulator YdaS (Cro superfamily)